MAKKTKTFGVRLDSQQVKFAEHLSAALGQPETTLLRRLVPTPPWGDVFLAYTRVSGETDPMAAPRLLMADGLRKLMATSASGPRSEYLDAIVCPDTIGQIFLEWCDGLSTLHGAVGPLGNRFVLVEGEYGFLPEPNPDWVAPQIQELVKLALADLRSSELPKRIEAGARLVQRLDLSADRVALLGRAIIGDVVALEELTAALEADPIGTKGGANG